MKKSILILFLLITSVVFAQIPPQLAPDGLETKFVSVDTLTTTQRDALTVTGAKGTIIFNSTTQSYEGYNPITTSWGAIGSGSVALPNREMAYGDATGTGITSHPNIQAYGSSGWIKLNNGTDYTTNLYANRLESKNLNDYSALFYNLLRYHNTTDGSMYIRPSAGYTDQVTLFYPPLTANDTIATLSDLTGGGHIIQDSGVAQTSRANLNFKTGFTVSDNAGNNSTDIDFTGTPAYSETFGNGVLTTIPITHNLGTEDIASVRIVDVATKETIQTTQIGVDANTINLIFATAPTTNQYRVTIKK